MAVEHLTKWVCDLCWTSETIPLLTKPPSGWVQISCNYEERCWHDKVICHHCLELIERQKRKPDFTPRLEKGVLNDPNNVAQSR